MIVIVIALMCYVEKRIAGLITHVCKLFLHFIERKKVE